MNDFHFDDLHLHEHKINPNGYSDYLCSNKKKSISSSGSYMLVHFETDHMHSSNGFSAKIHYTPITPICKDWLNITAGFLTSPSYPTIDCSWVITASFGSIISIQFHVFEVR